MLSGLPSCSGLHVTPSFDEFTLITGTNGLRNNIEKVYFCRAVALIKPRKCAVYLVSEVGYGDVNKAR